MKKKVLDDIKRRLHDRDEILFAYCLGTFLDGDDFKDIDVAVFLDKKSMTAKETVNYEIDISLLLESQIKPGEIFKRDVPIDVKVVNDAPPAFRYSVTRGALLFSKDDDVRTEFMSRTWREYFDFLPVAEQYMREVMDVEI